MQGVKSLKDALVGKERTTLDMPEAVKCEADEKIQLREALQALEQERKKKEAALDTQKELKCKLTRRSSSAMCFRRRSRRGRRRRLR